ncbi:hypothetical protein K7X08_002853 [Anisodus acutangulus]|uniref:Uncharacterized protein n=1 Tax=Anisodus acutangulus TaxID=402998 RepID=A0A9Q1MCZ4_9SOLA|nr:hypothetical protein K7X08_002853 [Anisodus acutangulus]
MHFRGHTSLLRLGAADVIHSTLVCPTPVGNGKSLFLQNLVGRGWRHRWFSWVKWEILTNQILTDLEIGCDRSVGRFGMTTILL